MNPGAWFVLLFFVSFFLIGAIFFWLYKEKSVATSQADFFTRLVSDFQKEILTLQTALKDQELDLSRQLHSHANENARLLQEAQSGYQSVMGGVQHRL